MYFSAAEDEISFDPDDMITHIDMVRVIFSFLLILLFFIS